MKNEYRRSFGGFGAGLGLFALAALGANARPARAATEPDAAAIVADWPKASRLTALAYIEKFGQPQRRDPQSLTWFQLYHGKRTVVHRGDDGAPLIEQVVSYRVPDEKIPELASFDDRISVNKEAGEMSALTDSQETDFLVLNLAHEIASGFKTVSEAQDFLQVQMQLAEAGKSSSYRDRLRFEQSMPVPQPMTEFAAPAVEAPMQQP